FDMPDGVLVLGDDVPPLPGQPLFPTPLQKLSEPGLVALLARWDHSNGKLGDTATNNWTSLPERMNFILNLFRSRQEHAILFSAPFTTIQRDALHANRVPEGKL